MYISNYRKRFKMKSKSCPQCGLTITSKLELFTLALGISANCTNCNTKMYHHISSSKHWLMSIVATLTAPVFIYLSIEYFSWLPLIIFGILIYILIFFIHYTAPLVSRD